MKHIKVIGAGVIGLSIAASAAEANEDIAVSVIAEKMTPEVTSSVAAAFWLPFHVEGLKREWATETLDHFNILTAEKSSGVYRVLGEEYFQSANIRDVWIQNAWWRDLESISFNSLPSSRVPAGFAAGVGYTVPVVHMPTYLSYLADRCARNGRTGIEIRKVNSLLEELDSASIVINCTGLGSRIGIDDLSDDLLFSCRGQVVCIEPIPEVDRLIFLTTGEYGIDRPLYIVPRRWPGGADVILGGTAFDFDYNESPNEQDTRLIIDRCAEIIPAIHSARIREVRVGLRPVRSVPGVRLDCDSRPQYEGRLWHCYGHGGAGVSLSWGCAGHGTVAH